MEAATRALAEELEIDDVNDLKILPVVNKEQESPSYPGLRSRYENNFFEVFLTKNQYNPDGYQEEQQDKITYWAWKQT